MPDNKTSSEAKLETAASRPTLSICIPTYNRAEFLDENLSLIVAKARPYNLPIYISDNGSTDGTREIVNRHSLLYDRIYYFRQQGNRGIDHNIATVLKMSQTDYAWLFSDDDRFFDTAIERMLDLLERHRPDMAVVNAVTNPDTMKPRIDSRSDLVYDDMALLLENICFHMTWLSTLIWSRKLIEQAPFGKYDGSALDFIHALFSALASGKRRVVWCSEPCIYIAKGASISWKGRVLEIYAKNAFNIIFGLPDSYSQDSKKKCLKVMGTRTDAFSLHGFFLLKKSGSYTMESYRAYRQYLPFVTNLPLSLCYIIALLPQSLFLKISAFKRWISHD